MYHFPHKINFLSFLFMHSLNCKRKISLIYKEGGNSCFDRVLILIFSLCYWTWWLAKRMNKSHESHNDLTHVLLSQMLVIVIRWIARTFIKSIIPLQWTGNRSVLVILGTDMLRHIAIVKGPSTISFHFTNYDWSMSPN